MVIFSPKRQTTNYMILEILGGNPPLTIRELHSLIKSRFSTAITYHGIYDRVQDLIEIDVLLKKDGRLQINPHWIDETERFFNSIKTNYNVKNRLHDLMGENKSMLLRFNTLSDFDRYLFNFEESFIENAKPDEQNIICWRVKHTWWPMLYMKRELDTLKRFKEKNISYYFTMGGNTPLDKYTYNFYERERMNMKIVPIKSVFSFTAVYNDLLFLNIYPPELYREIDEVFEKTTELQHLHVDTFHQLVSKRYPIHVLVIKNDYIVSQFKHQILSLFAPCLSPEAIRDNRAGEISRLISDAMGGLKAKAAMEPVQQAFGQGRVLAEKIKEKRAIIYLETSGCTYAKQHGGCSICGLMDSRQISPAETYRHFLKEFGKCTFRDDPVLCVYSNGSFFDEFEVPPTIRRKMLAKIAANTDIEELLIETRPEYVNEEIARESNELLKGKKMTVSLTLDVRDDAVRGVLRKGISLQDFKKAVAIFTKYGVGYCPFVCIKPPFLTEGEGIRVAIETIKFVLEDSPTAIFLEPIALQRYTIQEYLAQNNLYRPTYLWTVIEVLRLARRLVDSSMKDIRVKIGGEVFVPIPHSVAHNCEKCNEMVRQLIREYNTSFDLGVFNGILSLNEVKKVVAEARDNPEMLKKLNCMCQIEWLKAAEEHAEIPLSELDRRMKFYLGQCRPYAVPNIE